MLESTVKEEPKKAGIFTRWLEFAAALLLICITLVVTLQIVCRYILLELPPWSEELSRYLFIWANFVGAGVALSRNSHVSIDSLVTRLPDSVRRKLETFVVVLVTTFALFLLYQGVVTAVRHERQLLHYHAFFHGMGVCGPSRGGAYFPVVPIAEDFQTKRLGCDLRLGHRGRRFDRRPVVHREIYVRTPGPPGHHHGLRGDPLHGDQHAHFGRHRLGLYCLPSGQRQHTTFDRSHYDYRRDGLVCPPCGPPLCPRGRVDEYRRYHGRVSLLSRVPLSAISAEALGFPQFWGNTFFRGFPAHP